MVWRQANEQTREGQLQVEIRFYMQFGFLEKCKITRVGYRKLALILFLETEKNKNGTSEVSIHKKPRCSIGRKACCEESV